jgi:hypothetical protein
MRNPVRLHRRAKREQADVRSGVKCSGSCLVRQQSGSPSIADVPLRRRELAVWRPRADKVDCRQETDGTLKSATNNFSLSFSRIPTIIIGKRERNRRSRVAPLACGTLELYFFGSLATDILDARDPAPDGRD